MSLVNQASSNLSSHQVFGNSKYWARDSQTQPRQFKAQLCSLKTYVFVYQPHSPWAGKLHNRALTSLGRVRLSLAQSFELPKTWWLPRLEDAWFTSGINEATRRLGTMAPNFIALVSQYFWGRHLFFLVTVHIFLLPMVSFFLPFMHYYQDTLQLRLQKMIRLNSSQL